MNDIQAAVSQAVAELGSEILSWSGDGKRPPIRIRQKVGEIGLAAAMLSKLRLRPHETILATKIAHTATSVLYNEVFFYISYYHVPRDVSSGDVEKIQRLLTRNNVDTLAMRLNIATTKGKLGGSTDEYFFDRLRQITNGLDTLFAAGIDECYTPALYTACNVHQTLVDYLDLGEEAFRKVASQWLARVSSVIARALRKPDVQRVVECNPQLTWFLEAQRQFHRRRRDLPPPDIPFETEQMTPVQLLRSLGSLAEISAAEFERQFAANEAAIVRSCQAGTPIERALGVRVCLRYLLQQGVDTIAPIDFVVPAPRRAVHFDPAELFSSYGEILDIEVDSADLALLHSWNDAELRSRVARTIRGVDPAVLDRELRKPHGSSEIADMEFELRRGSDPLWICLPFKSGREIRSTVPENVAYQILRPFQYFDRCVVVFVSARKCSEDLMNYLKLSTGRFGWPIHVIAGEQLAKLLKANGLLELGTGSTEATPAALEPDGADDVSESGA